VQFIVWSIGRLLFHNIISKWGYLHDHGLLWIANAPRYGTHSNEEIKNFIDKYLTTNHFILEEHLRSAQTHQHMQTCQKKGKVVC
jgi:hypothetical protein